jgi:GTP-binding protein HflX
LVAVQPQYQSRAKTEAYLAELEFLAETLGIVTEKKFLQGLEKPDKKTFVGKGKIAEIAAYVSDRSIDMVIFDDDLTTAHVRNLDGILKNCLVIDRSLLILQIFSMRAQTNQSRLQVELAQYQYMLPRLTNLWTHHSRQKGGIGMKGPGETELETDKRIIKERIAFLKEKLEKVDIQSQTRSKSRQKEVRVALVGYTNTGKSTLMRRLSKADVFAENKLFATVDSTVRKIALEGMSFLLSDTVGFIRKLPTMLVESFKSTLSEIVEADILLHVVDISSDEFEEQIEVVNKILGELKCGDKKTILVFNKIDAFVNKEYPPFDQHPPATLQEWKQSYLAKTSDAVFISATESQNLGELREKLYQAVAEKYFKIYPNTEKLFSYQIENLESPNRDI